MNYRLASAAFLGAAALAACAGHSGTANLPPAPRGVQSVSTSGGVTTVSGPVVAIKSSGEFQVNGGSGCGYLNIYTTSSTTFSPAGAKPAVGDYSVSSGSGSCATYLTATSVTLSTPSPSPAPSPGSSPTPFPASYTIGSGGIFGADNVFSPNDGDTSSGGQGQTVDGMPCVSTMPNAYHVHSFAGIIINGRQLALPDGIGMKNPGADGTYYGFPNWTEYASCYYYIHTHDASGVFHVESPQSVSLSSSIYTLGNAFDMWGMTLSSTQIGPYTGTVRAYVANVPLKTAQILRSYYTQYSGDPRSIPIYSHTTTWLEIGPTYVTPSSLPVLNYYEEY
ncbi:MAG TPA: hypothetical protein VFN37_03790 [Candidatus Baltobacteraceae bacterium]|nr:hypothetical protein [Candidatus Baltobacteraceae bacterium]